MHLDALATKRWGKDRRKATAVTEDGSAGRHRPGRGWVLYVGAVAAVLVVALVIVLSLKSDDKDSQAGTDGPSASPSATTSASSSPAKAEPLAHFTGSGDQTTTSFRAAVNWELRWKTEADKQFTVELLDKDGTSRGEIVAAGKKKEGSVFVSEAGEFKLKVTTPANWSIDIVGARPAD
jgi:hypothetical protein